MLAECPVEYIVDVSKDVNYLGLRLDFVPLLLEHEDALRWD